MSCHESITFALAAISVFALAVRNGRRKPEVTELSRLVSAAAS